MHFWAKQNRQDLSKFWKINCRKFGMGWVHVMEWARPFMRRTPYDSCSPSWTAQWAAVARYVTNLEAYREVDKTNKRNISKRVLLGTHLLDSIRLIIAMIFSSKIMLLECWQPSPETASGLRTNVLLLLGVPPAFHRVPLQELCSELHQASWQRTWVRSFKAVFNQIQAISFIVLNNRLARS